uniref:AN1-type domain-containing protein n=1 Tax=Ciona savignyi TaxID=51511 RepID=H2YZ22_CIOSA
LTEILSAADVILATNQISPTGAHSKGPLQHLPPDHFDDVIIDECGQSLEAACWISILRARRCILAGDHLQLPPTIISHKAAENGLSTTLLERMIGLHGEQVVAMLTEQYRMHAHIMQWASNGMYDGKLVANYAVQSHLLSDLPHVEQTEDTGIPMLLIDTSGCNMGEMESEESISKANEGEAMIVCAHVDSLVKAGVGEREIAVISPYNLQVDILRQMLKEKHPNIEIKSVDGFQGREKEAVILTLVRSNPHKEIGFLSDRRRLNVAVTRARRHLTVICDSTTVCNDKFIKSLVDHITKHGEVRTGFEYADEDLQSSTNLRPKQSKKTSPKPAMPQLTLIEIQAKYQYIIEQLLGQRNILKGQSESTLFNFSELTVTIKQIINARDHFEISFPAALNSAERKAIHNLCEEMGFGHQSIGEDKERQVVISVPALDSPDNILPETKQEVNKQTTTETMDKNILTPVESVSKESIERFDLSQLPEDNMTMHLIHCERLIKMKEQVKTPQNENRKKIHSQPSKSKNKKNTKSANKQRNTGDFDLLNQAISSNKFCFHSNCAASITTTGQLCSICRKTFCLKHHIPEVHGCGAQAHINARRQIIRDGVLYSGSGVPDRKPDPTKRAQLKNRLDSKMKSLEKERKSGK